MNITMLGTGNAMVTECYNTCFVLQDGEKHLLVDGGGGNTLLRQLKQAGFAWQDMREIFVTHKHVDHLMGIVWMIRMIATKMKKDQYIGDAHIYCHAELIETIKTEEKVCNYLDIPIQHASDAVLKRMGRRTNNKEIRGLIAKLRKEIPDIALRTTLISGFPGETEEDHEILMQFVDDMEFDRLGVFAYSPEEDTPAFSLENQVPEEVKQERRDEIMELQQEIAFEKSEAMKGRTLEVMIEGKVADENAYVGRTYMDSPNVDGLIFVNTGLSLMSGDFLKVRVTGASEYDLIGEAEDEFTE